MTTTPVAVYLDSSDFSRLSDPNASASLKVTRDRLVELAGQPSVRFLFSGAHISEMAPVASQFTPSATARTDLLVTLCQRNCLISFDRLVVAETARLADPSLPPVDAVTDDGTWFPDIGQIVTPAQALGATKALDDKASELQLNRQQRRILKSKTTKNGRFRAGTLDAVGAGSLDDILAVYPMRRQDADVLMQFMVGTMSAARADAAFLESLRDPRWMMRWFQQHHDRLGVVGEWVRAPARKLSVQMETVASAAAHALAFERLTGANVLSDKLSTENWRRAQEKMLLDVINKVADAGQGAMRRFDSIDVADERCPGISMCVRVAHSSLRNSIGANARTPTPSDFVDAVHAMYAPYVDVFRADRYMSPIISSHATKYGTAVLSRVEDVPAQIETLLKR